METKKQGSTETYVMSPKQVSKTFETKSEITRKTSKEEKVKVHTKMLVDEVAETIARIIKEKHAIFESEGVDREMTIQMCASQMASYYQVALEEQVKINIKA